ncbi:hypothetical protein [Alicyclobacillus sp. SO9]|uniref:hypothetical protein n=1 Tax=Alicyclobacillus sp. SO9 TaxID=2665646 RepID=UPI0018E85103|nr:hypothetical protein [Alicyclobacillus sp. SO9]QQE79626.1 hypothetical protein GI364_03805 [Alicyclobacillus sp. SO9]
MSDTFHIPTFGSIPSLSAAVLDTPENAPDLVVRDYAPYKRFGVQVDDMGLDTFGLFPGDWAIFREQRWPNMECQIVLVAFGEEGTLRLFEGTNETEPILRVSGERIPEERHHRNDFIILGVLDGVIKAEFAQLSYPEPILDWEL